MSENDLVNIVHPTKKADPNLYTAALEHHKYEGKNKEQT